MTRKSLPRIFFVPLLAGLMLLGVQLVLAQDAAPEPVSVAEDLSTVEAIGVEAITIDLPANDLIYDAERGKIYASVPGSVSGFGNRIVPIDVPTGTLGTPIFVGSNPNRLAMSGDGQFLYVGLDGASAVRRVNLETQTAELQFSLGGGSCGSNIANDIVVLRNRPHSVAVSLNRTGCSPAHAGVAIYDDGVRRDDMTSDHTGANLLEPAWDNPNKLYGYNNESTGYDFFVLSINDDGVHVDSSHYGVFEGFFNDLRSAGRRLYASTGKTVNPATLTIVGTYDVPDFATAVAPYPSQDRVYFVGNRVLHIMEESTFTHIGSVTIPTSDPFVFFNAQSLITIGNNRLAFRTDSQIYLLRLFNFTPVPPDSVEIHGPEAGVVGQAYTFTATVLPANATTPIEYSWDFEGYPAFIQTSGVTDTATWTWNVTGTYPIMLTADNEHALASAVHAMTIYLPSEADFTAAPLTGTAPLSVTFSNLSSGGYSDCLWEFGDGQVDSSCEVTHTYKMSGTFDVTLTVSGPGGVDVQMRPGYIAVDAPPLTFNYLPSIRTKERAPAPTR